jgi:Rieske Fe-S protein
MTPPVPEPAGTTPPRADTVPLTLCECRPCPSRRQFLAQTTLLAVAAMLAACGQSATGPSFHGPLNVDPANFPGLSTVGGIAVVDNGTRSGVPIAVVRTGAATFLALSLVCPHRGFTVAIAGNGFLCPGHGAQFNGSGHWIGGQPTSSLSAYPTSYNAATGVLTIG